MRGKEIIANELSILAANITLLLEEIGDRREREAVAEYLFGAIRKILTEARG